MIYYKRNKENEKKVWHKWFAWFPVVVETTKDGDSKKVWMEYVLRCKKFYHYFDDSGYLFYYKEIK